MELKDLVGKHVLKGVKRSFVVEDGESCEALLFNLDGNTYAAVEDPDDGYRSYLSELRVLPSCACAQNIPDIEVFCMMDEGDDRDVLEMRDIANAKIVLRIGTEDTDDYYPYCVMEYSPENFSVNEVAEIAKSAKRTDIVNTFVQRREFADRAWFASAEVSYDDETRKLSIVVGWEAISKYMGCSSEDLN